MIALKSNHHKPRTETSAAAVLLSFVFVVVTICRGPFSDSKTPLCYLLVSTLSAMDWYAEAHRTTAERIGHAATIPLRPVGGLLLKFPPLAHRDFPPCAAPLTCAILHIEAGRQSLIDADETKVVRRESCLPREGVRNRQGNHRSRPHENEYYDRPPWEVRDLFDDPGTEGKRLD